jgi:hypothetical protein
VNRQQTRSSGCGRLEAALRLWQALRCELGAEVTRQLALENEPTSPVLRRLEIEGRVLRRVADSVAS